MSWWIVAAYLAVAWVFGLWIMIAPPILAARADRRMGPGPSPRIDRSPLVEGAR